MIKEVCALIQDLKNSLRGITHGKIIDESFKELKRLFSERQEYKTMPINIHDALQTLEDKWNQYYENNQHTPQLLQDTLHSLKLLTKDEDKQLKLMKLQMENNTLRQQLQVKERNQIRDFDSQLYHKLKPVIQTQEHEIKQLNHRLQFQKKTTSQIKEQQLVREIEELKKENLKYIEFHKNYEVDQRELSRLKQDNKIYINENIILQNKIHDLQDQLELEVRNDREKQIAELQRQMKTAQGLLSQKDQEIKQLKLDLEDMRIKLNSIKKQKSSNLKIKLLPEMKRIGSHVNCVLHLLENVHGFGAVLTKQEDQVSILLNKFIQFIRNDDVEIDQKDAQSLTDLLPLELQHDNRANDFLFQIVDYLSRAVEKPLDAVQSPIANIIQAKDSPIYDLFFFLQRIVPLQKEIQNNEIPLINSIKHVRYFESVLAQSKTFGEYLTHLIELEGTENQIDDNPTPFNVLVFPQIMVLNVIELSLAKADIQIEQELSSKVLNAESEYLYKLTGIVHCSVGDKDPLYYLTIRQGDKWIQLLFDSFETIQIGPILTFVKGSNDKELLIYEKII